MNNIKDVINRVVAQMASHEQSSDTSIDRLINHVLTEKEKQHVKLVGVKSDALLFCVNSSAWLYQMNIRKKSLLEKIQESKPEIQKLSFKIGKVV